MPPQDRPATAAVKPSTRALSRESVAAAALALADSEGFAALTMRRLAQELGVGTMTLYGYVRDKDDLVDAMVDVAVAEISIPERRGPWRARARRLALEWWRNLARHPSGVQLHLATGPVLNRNALLSTEAGFEYLQEAGFSGEELARAFRTLFVYVFGFAAFNAAPPGGAEEEEVRSAMASLPPDEYPVLVASADYARAVTGTEEQFLYGLERILDGLEATLEDDRRRGRDR
jgi:AcrR family transcriptional regulator